MRRSILWNDALLAEGAKGKKMGCEDVGYLCPDNALKPLNTDLSAPLQQACHGCRMYAE
jgi:hypothetical protein